MSSAELERVMGLHPNVGEVAAVAVQPPVHLTLTKLRFLGSEQYCIHHMICLNGVGWRCRRIDCVCCT